MVSLKRIILTIVLTAALVACQTEEVADTPSPTATAQATATPSPTDTPPSPTATPIPGPQINFAVGQDGQLVSGTGEMAWWNDTVFYEIFVRSFYDSDGDGIGDINGLIEKLDYLNDGDPTTTSDLGVTGLWLMPITTATSYHGYDTTDYYSVDPAYGTNEDFQRLIEEAHARGIRVIIDLVFNHTGLEHPWFEESRDPASERRDWYLWGDERPTYSGPWGQSVWHAADSAFYYGVFWGGMPDLNFNNQDVTDQIFDITRFWLEEMNADGFRLDAIKHLIEDGAVQENTNATYNWMSEYYTFYKEIEPDAFTVGEVWSATPFVVRYIGDKVDIAFEFDLAMATMTSASTGFNIAVSKTMPEIVAQFPANQYGTFLTNHDQNRVMSQLDGNIEQAKVAASMYLLSPGVPFVYYGEEIGMSGIKPDPQIRRPMHWTSQPNRVGFTTGTPWQLPDSRNRALNVADMMGDDASLLNHYRELIQLRNQHAALRVGDWRLLETDNIRLYAFVRHFENETLIILINLNARDITTDDYTLALESGPFAAVSDAWTLYGGEGQIALPSVNDMGGFDSYTPIDTIAPYSTMVIQYQH